jgi:hypothetical protein
MQPRTPNFPTHEDIERRAYEIYLERGQEHSHSLEHWFAAEAQLLRERGEQGQHGANALKTATIVVGPNGVAETTPERDSAIAKEETAQVRASEKLKEEQESGAIPRTKVVSVGQKRTK